MVTYTDWDKVATYTMPFHNSHVLNEALDPDPSNNPSLPFEPDIITRYDFLDLDLTSMPAAWAGLDLLNPGQVSDAQILQMYGDAVPIPLPSTHSIWLGSHNADWGDPVNWLPAVVPGLNDTVRINSCACPEVHYPVLPEGATAIAGMHIMEGGQLDIPAGATLMINGPLHNEGTITVFGLLSMDANGSSGTSNYGVIECKSGGVMQIED
jgi:hypothetical protein